MKLLSAIILPLAIHITASAQSSNVDMMHAEFAALAENDSLPLSTTIDRDYIYTNTETAESPFIRGRRGILIIGKRDTARAVEPFSYAGERLNAYAAAVNRYAELFGDSVNIYCMPVPTSCAYYTPDKARIIGGEPTRRAMLQLFDALSPSVTAVDLYPVLGEHADEPIYSRTDHHWAPLGAAYAAERFAELAEVPFTPLEYYDTCRIEGYVGTMARFANSETIRRSPEVFEYYKPRRNDYSTTYVVYTLDKKRLNVISESEPVPGSFFKDTARGSSSYLVFMGGDSRLTKVDTNAPSGRRLLILKDSFGNAIPGYLFDSFGQIHVADCRYFTPNIRDYIAANGITDILFVNNMAHVITPRTAESYLRYLEQ